MGDDSKGGSRQPIFRERTRRFWLLELVIDVRTDGLHVRLSPLERSFRSVPAAEIVAVEVTTYSPGTYSGWHWGVRQTAGGNTVYRLRGDRGVEATLQNGDRWFVGSQRPEELANALERVRSDSK